MGAPGKHLLVSPNITNWPVRQKRQLRLSIIYAKLCEVLHYSAFVVFTENRHRFASSMLGRIWPGSCIPWSAQVPAYLSSLSWPIPLSCLNTLNSLSSPSCQLSYYFYSDSLSCPDSFSSCLNSLSYTMLVFTGWPDSFSSCLNSLSYTMLVFTGCPDSCSSCLKSLSYTMLVHTSAQGHTSVLVHSASILC